MTDAERYAKYRQKYPTKVLLFRSSRGVFSFGEDALILKNLMGDRVHYVVGQKHGDVDVAGTRHLDATLKALLGGGYQVALIPEDAQ